MLNNVHVQAKILVQGASTNGLLFLVAQIYGLSQIFEQNVLRINQSWLVVAQGPILIIYLFKFD